MMQYNALVKTTLLIEEGVWATIKLLISTCVAIWVFTAPILLWFIQMRINKKSANAMPQLMHFIFLILHNVIDKYHKVNIVSKFQIISLVRDAIQTTM